MALRNDIQLEKDSLNDSLTRMKSINNSLKLSEQKSQSETLVPQSQASNGFSFLNLDRYDFLRKYFPTSHQTSPVKSFSSESIRTNLHTNSPGKCESVESLLNGPTKSPAAEFKYESVLKKIRSTSPAKTEAKYESLLKNIAPKYESIAEASESPTLIVEAGVEEKDDFLKKSLTSVHKLPESPSAVAYGSFLGDASPREDTVVADAEAERIPSDDQESEEVVKASDKDEEALNQTFEMDEDQSFLFKTPLAPKYYKRDESGVVFKTPKSSVFSRFQTNDDNNDSFVENERTIMLQFRNEAAVTDVEKEAKENESVAPAHVTLDFPDSSTCVSTTAVQNTAETSTVSNSTCMTKDYTLVKQPDALVDFMLEQRKQLELFVQEQAQQFSQFILTQNEAYNKFIANMGRDEKADETEIVECVLQKENNPKIIISEPECAESEIQNTVVEHDTLDSTACQSKCSSSLVKVEDEAALESADVSSVIQPSGSSDQSMLDVSKIPRMAETALEEKDDTCSFRPRTRQSMAFSNFKKNCSILKTPSRSRSSMANTTAMFTPGSLSVCIRDQLEALEDDLDT